MKLYETITADNWGKGTSSGHLCLLAHFARRYRTKPDAPDWLDTEEFSALKRAVAMLYPERGPANSTAFFNDHPDTTVDDVIRVCKVADV